MSEADWDLRDGAVVEKPRRVRDHPLLAAVYGHHDDLISSHLPGGKTLELAFGQYMHPRASVGLEAWPSNVRGRERAGIVGDARSIPFADDSFDAVVGRRFLHHVPRSDRLDIVREAARVLRPGGRLVLLEGTPGLYRTVTKGLAFRLGVLGEDNDVYGHLSSDELRDLVATEFDVVEDRVLGSPLMVASVAESDASKWLFPLYQRTQVVTWWTLVVGRAE